MEIIKSNYRNLIFAASVVTIALAALR